MSLILRFTVVCWEGLTLLHIKERKIIISYILFLIMAALFEIYLAGLLIYTGILYYTYSYSPDLPFYLCTGIILACLTLTVSLCTVIGRSKFFNFKD